MEKATDYTKCSKCKKYAVHLCMSSCEWYGDQDDTNGNPSEYHDVEPPVGQEDVSIYAHKCFECGNLEDVGVESPRDKVEPDFLSGSLLSIVNEYQNGSWIGVLDEILHSWIFARAVGNFEWRYKLCVYSKRQ